MNEIWRMLRYNRNFIAMLGTVGATILADILVLGGLLTDVYERSGSALQTVFVSVAMMITGVIISPFSGVWADRVPRKLMLAGANWGRAVIILGAYFLIQTGRFEIWHAYVVSVCLMAGSALRTPARMSLMPQIIQTEQLVLANSIVKVVYLALAALGYWLAGTLIITHGLGLIASIAIVGYFIGGLSVLFMQVAPPEKEESEQAQVSVWQSAADGFQHLRQHRIARPLTIMEALESVPQGIWTQGMLLVFVERALNGNSADWGMMTGLFQIAFLIGTLIAIAVNRWINQYAGQVIIADTLATAIIGIPFVLSPNPEWATLFYFLLAMPQSLRDSAQDSLLQATVDNAILGRIYAFRGMAAQFTGLGATVLFAWLAAFIEIRILFGVAAGLFVLVAIYAYTNSALRTSRIEVESVEPQIA